MVILSDGDANVGKSSWEAMLQQIKGFADQGITLSTIGFGQGNYRDTLMEQLANKGDGNNFYVDSQRESDLNLRGADWRHLDHRRARHEGSGGVQSSRREQLPSHRIREP